MWACGSKDADGFGLSECEGCTPSFADGTTASLWVDMTVRDERVTASLWRDHREVSLETALQGTPLEWSLSLPAIITGIIETDASPAAKVLADVSATRQTSWVVDEFVALRTTRVRSQTGGPYPTRGVADVVAADYEIAMPPYDATYEVAMQPVGEAGVYLPPMWTTVQVTGGVAVPRLDFVVPAQRSSIAGSVVDEHGAALGFEVQAVQRDEPSSQPSLSLRGVSTIATASADGFQMYLPKQIDLQRVWLKLTPPVERGAYPVLFVDPSTLLADPSGQVMISVPSRFPTARWEGVVLSAGRPVAGATVRFESSSVRDGNDDCSNVTGTGLRGAYSTRVQTGEDGSFSAELPLGEYVVAVVRTSGERANEQAGVWTFPMDAAKLTCRDKRTSVVYSLPEVYEFGFVALDQASGNPVPGAVVQVTQVAGFETNTVMTTATTDAQGRVTVLLPLGVYDIVCKPTGDSSDRPWVARRGVELRAEDAGRTYNLEIGAREAVRVTGTVLGAWGFVPTEGVKGVHLTAYWVFRNASTVQVIPAAASVTNDQGTFDFWVESPQSARDLSRSP
jgi:hypothetical protein